VNTKLTAVRTMRLGFVAMVALLLTVGVAAYRSAITANDSAEWSEHTRQVLENVELLRLAMENVESGYRDFALSGDGAFLLSSGDNISLVDQERKYLRALTSDNPEEQRRLDILDDLTQQLILRGQAFVRLPRSGAAQSPVAAVLKAQIDPILVKFRSVTVDMRDEERRLLQIRDTGAQHTFRQTQVALIAGTALGVLIALASGWMLPRAYGERLKAENKLKRLNRLYAMVSGITALGIRARDRDDLFGNSCHIAVEHGEFAMAWIGLSDRGGTRLVPMAWAGADSEARAAIEGVFSSDDGTLQGNTLVAQAIRGKATLVANDVQSDQRMLLARMHVKAGVRSIAILPLIVADKAIGVFVLYTNNVEFFDAAGLTLLTELADNIAFAIDHMEKQERLDHFAYYDALTGLANRRLFLDRVTQHMLSATSGGHKLALFLFDLERFKKFNDSLGRPVGDALLKQVADWLAQNAGNDNVVARMGADQFAVVLPDVSHEAGVARSLEKTLAAFLNHAFSLNDVVYRIAAKAGVALFPDDGTDADTLFKNAEAALKKAKVAGDRYLFYAQKMTETVAGSLGIENRLRQALEREQFVLHYQPKVNLVTGKVTGAEALIRWNDPQTGLVPPARFIPILEEIGLIHEVGRWALHKAIEDYHRWRNAGLTAVRIAVNVSPLQLRSRSFVTEIEEAISMSPEAAAGLELEITESLIMEDVDHSIVSLLAIRAMGVTIAIDDFGTGFSSLNYLFKLPVNTLKIDRAFVVDMISGAGGLTLVSVIVNLAHALKLKVVAEGVETEAQLRQLRLLHCDEMQGYLFGKPVPVEIFETKYLTPADGLALDAARLRVT
jgi:diguanylate cyclase (GGDEF)-like protein